jgi:uncharacterized protein
MSHPLMPMATAVWLVDNSGLTFRQIAEFCGLHVLEVQGIADETVATKIVGQDPIRAGQLTQEEITRCEQDSSARLQILEGPDQKKRTKGPRYTPVSKRVEKPDGIAWLLRNHPELSDGQIGRLIGTTKSTIAQIRDRTHWNMANIRPQDPVALGLCHQRDLDALVAKAAKKSGIKPGDPRLEEEAAKLADELKLRRAEQKAQMELEAALEAEMGEGQIG